MTPTPDTPHAYAPPALTPLGAIHEVTAGTPIDDGSGNLSCPDGQELFSLPPEIGGGSYCDGGAPLR